jgi:TatD DNase family protein
MKVIDPDREAVLTRAVSAGVDRIITIGVDVNSSRRAVELAEDYPSVSATVGLHPLYVPESPGAEDAWKELQALACHPKVVAIGEVGLDFSRLSGEGRERERQKSLQAEALQRGLNLALQTGLPVVIHQRQAWEEIWEILSLYVGRVRAVFHCFGGTEVEVKRVLSAGWLVSFTGIVTFRKSQPLRDLAARLPAGSFMVETDAPFLAPEPHRGRRNEPAWVLFTLEALARARKERSQILAQTTTETALGFFPFRD